MSMIDFLHMIVQIHDNYFGNITVSRSYFDRYDRDYIELGFDGNPWN